MIYCIILRFLFLTGGKMKKFLVAAVVLATVFAFAACGGGKKSKPEIETDEDQVETEDSDDDGEAVVPDGGNDDEENDGDSNQPGGNDDTPVVPDNDRPSGGDPCDPNPCTEPNKTVCTVTGDNSYTCSCDRLTCEINGACIADRDRNPLNSCEECNRDYSKTSWSLVADGKDCEAKPGLMGSGTCRNGVCGGFGTCDNRAYGLKAGSPCNRDVECETGYCYTWYDYSGSDSYGWTRASVCTGACKEDEDCPDNMTCQYFEKQGYQCMPLVVAGVKRPNPKMKDYGPCNVDDDCEGGLCLSYGEGESFCASECTKSLLGDSCGSCGRCKEDGAERGFKYDKYCVPKGSGALGDHCQSNMDCESGGCYDGYCVKTCGGIFNSCGNGYTCGTLPAYFGSSEVCYDPNRFDLPDGTYCNYDEQCASGECIEFEGDMICASHCVDTQVTDPETGETSTAKTCENGSQCLAVKKVNDYGNTYADYICAQNKMLKRLEFGEDCYSDWQCEDGYTCFEGLFCSKACTEDSQCPIDKTCYIYGQQESEDGGDPQIFGVCISKEQQSVKAGNYCPYVWSCEMCYKDYTVQQYYCTKECEKDSDCFDIGGCYDGICQKAIPYRSDIYAACRFDDDCEKYTNCEHGMCTSDCSADSNCDGYNDVNPTGTQKTCMPCETDTDCKKVFYDYGSCVTDYDGNKFCLEDCSDNYTLCPEGTRCNGSYCYPISGSCKGGKAYCNSESNCAVPTLLDDWICRTNKECYSGKCGDNYCQKDTCSTDADCGCGFKECKNGNCVPKESLGTLEAEPNDTLAAAQEVSSDFVFAGFGHKNNEEDFDYFKISAKAGQYLKVRTHPYCGETRADTFVALFDSDGAKVAENDYMDYCYFTQNYYYAEIMNYKVPSNGYYYAMVRQNPSSAKALYNMPYILEMDAFTPVEHNVCSGAKELQPGNYEESMKRATDSLDTKSCSGYYGYGPDLFYKVTVPAGKMMTFKVTPKSGSFDPTISVLSDCGEIADVCLAGNSFGDFGNPEEIVYYNDSEADKDYIVVVDSVVAPLEYDFSISLEISDAPAVPENDKIDGVTPLEGRGSLQGYTVSANDDFSPAQGICNGGTFTGNDVVYSMDMAAGDYFHAEISASFAAAIYVVKADEPDSCLYGGGLINFETDETTAGLYYLVIDATNPSDYGAFSMTYIKEQADKDACKGICTSSYRMCLPDKSDICMCDSSLGILYPSNCDSYCASEGGVSGSCETTYKTDGVTIDRNGCICTFDCTDTAKVAELCSDYTPSNCTCGSSDVCSWKNNGSCDKMCSDFFPSDHFDDSADCG